MAPTKWPEYVREYYSTVHVNKEEDIHGVVGNPEPGLIMEKCCLERNGKDSYEREQGSYELPELARTSVWDKGIAVGDRIRERERGREGEREGGRDRSL